MSAVTQAKRIVIKVGTSTLTYESGRLNLRRVERLCKVLSDLQNSGREIVLVSSGAIGVGVGKLGLRERPRETEKRQAVAAVGQCELMFIYDKFFGEYNRIVAQVLLTGDVTANEYTRKNTENTFQELIGMDIIPVVNENDTVVVDELVGNQIGDNDTLSAIVARLIGADLLVILTDIDGLYDGDPSINPNARRIPFVPKVTDEIRALAGGAGSRRGTGGMRTKVDAAALVNEAGIPCCIASGAYPEKLYNLFEGAQIGTVFGKKKE
jgi:glutamate 5-kinase